MNFCFGVKIKFLDKKQRAKKSTQKTNYKKLSRLKI